jgi:hypothetical protein
MPAHLVYQAPIQLNWYELRLGYQCQPYQIHMDWLIVGHSNGGVYFQFAENVGLSIVPTGALVLRRVRQSEQISETCCLQESNVH